jgi:transposase
MRNEKRQAYSSDLSDDEWISIKPLIKEDVYYGPKGRTKHSRREMLDAIFYVVKTGCQWRELPHDFPSWKGVYGQFLRWKRKGLFEKIHDSLRRSLRGALGRNEDASVGIADSQSVKTTEKKGSVAMTGVRKLKAAKGISLWITLD